MAACRTPGRKSQRVISRDHRVASPSYGRVHSFVYKRGKGCWLWDMDGRKYLDFAAGIAVMNVGHSNPEVVSAVKKQLSLGLHAGFPDFYAETSVRFIEKLFSLLPGFGKAFLTNSGTESVEAALKLAKWSSGKKWLIAFDHCFHGRTMGSLSMTNSKPVQQKGFGPFLPVKHAEFPYPYRSKLDDESLTERCIQSVVKRVKEVKGDVAAVFVEPIQGEGGYVVPPAGFHKELRKLCTEEGILLCGDEIQAGCFRTGTFLALQGFGVKPDLVCLAKAIGGGLPIGAMVAKKSIMRWPEGSHSNTFGGNLLACAAGTAALDFMKKKRLGENVKNVGKHILTRLEELKERYEIIGDVRGRGLMIGIEIVKDKKSKRFGIEERKKIICSAEKAGLLMLPAGKSVVRMCPPLVLTKEQADKGLEIFEKAVKSV
ncbi:MAG: aminotransferase class III-fold pyridoxal phosphate-dependent enzyme [Candidatus Aenigmarchaeota archaeon]|nr:aminotransferase class III-fold pyridoxal phosphate-dependent enzyme [Candidatus Aenigmarchaeota archaeon]